MLAIVKIQEGYCVVDLDEDTKLFDSLEEAQEIAGGILLEARSQTNKMKTYSKKMGKIMNKNDEEDGGTKALTWDSGRTAAEYLKKGMSSLAQKHIRLGKLWKKTQ